MHMFDRTNMGRICTVTLLCLGIAWLSTAEAEDAPSPWLGKQTVGMMIGGILPLRLMDAQSSKLNGISVHPSWQTALTDPIGESWLSGSVVLGAEAAFLGITEPTGAYGIGLTPKVGYAFTSFGRLKPFIEGGGGPLWTNFDGRIPEQGSDFNFLVWAGGGASYDLTARWALNAGVRFSHISNADTDSPNRGLNYLQPFIGVTSKLF